MTELQAERAGNAPQNLWAFRASRPDRSACATSMC